jgi:hypothetical protein
MKKVYGFLLFMVMLIAVENVKAQFSPGVDLYSSYVWRGAKFGSGPAIQPYVDYTTGGFSVGAWGSICTSTDEAYEMDLYAKYALPFGLTIGLNDYYFGSSDSTGFFVGDYFKGTSHYFEPTLSFTAGGFSIMGAYMIGDGVADTYLEAGYGIGNVSLFVGAGNGQYTSDGGFMVCNVGVKATEELKITETFSIPMNGSVILNPSTQAFHIVVGVSF